MEVARCDLVMCPKVICSGWLIKSFSWNRDWSDWLLLCPWSIFGKLVLKRLMRLLKDAPLGEDSMLWCTLLSNKPTLVHLRHQKWTAEKLLLTVQLSSGESGLSLPTFQYDAVVCICYFFTSHFYCFCLDFETWNKHEVGDKGSGWETAMLV